MYLTAAELSTNLYPEIQAAISRASETQVDAHVETALDTIRAKLSSLYNIEAEYAKTGSDRNNLLVNLAKDIAIYHLYSTQETIPAIRVKRYDEAMSMLNDLQQAKSTLTGVAAAPIDEEELPVGTVAFGSNTKRVNYI